MTESSSSSASMTPRREHLDWCKKRALAYLNAGDLTNAFASMASDLGKHPETADAAQLVVGLGMPLLLAGQLDTPKQMRDWIEGFR